MSEEEQSVRISGRVKWFDLTKGYGFIADDGPSDDVMLHISAIRDFGVDLPREGDRITCKAVRRAKGLQALEILDFIKEAPAPETVASDEELHSFQTGTVKWYNRIKGYGFLTLESEEGDVFIHAETLSEAGFTTLEPEQNVLVKLTTGSKGLTANCIRAIPEHSE